MRKKLLTLLALALSLASSTWALDQTGSGLYLIGSAADLQAFATLVNSNTVNATANAVLTADIDMSTLNSWTAIGDWHADGFGYKGHFDGQGHVISNFNFTATHSNFGLFGVTPSGCLIENFTIEGTITVSGNKGYAGGVVAYAKEKTNTIRNVHSIVNINSTSTASTPRIGGILGGVAAQNSNTVIDRCTYSGTINANDKGGNYGGIVGYILNNSNVSADITNCLFDGKLQSSINSNSAQLGGIIGYTRAGIVSVENCLSFGTFEYASGNAMNVGQFIGRLTFDSGTSGCTFANNYYKDMGYELYGTSSGGAPKGSAPVEATATQLTSGELCVLLNNNENHGTNWYQTLGTDNYPTPNGSDLVYKYDSYDDCAMTTPTTGTISYTNTPTSPAHTYTDGICSTCNYINPNYASKNSEGYYEIGTPSQLKWFAAWVNSSSDNFSSNAVLTDDIDMTSIAATWIPIGNWGQEGNGVSSAAYKGHFNGQGHAITNFNGTSLQNYYALFGVISTSALIENFSIAGEITSGSTSHQYISGVAAYARDASPAIRNVKSTVNINNSINGNGRHAGILGGALNGTTTIQNCTYSGTIHVSGVTGNYGGIVGYANNNTNAHLTISNCLFDGTVEDINGGNGECGGIIGFASTNSDITIENCLSVGTVSSTKQGMICGIIAGTKTFTNNYYKDCGVDANGPNSNVAYTAKAVSADQLASGEVAYLLNESVGGGTNWYQTLPGDANPTLDSTHGLVYLNGTVCPDTGTPQGTASYSNTEGTTEGSHHPVDGFCTYCGTVDDNYMTPIDSYYMIGTPAQLKWFAAFVNAGHPAVNAKLVNITPLDLTGVTVEPIGNSSVAYTGTFDGQGNSISNYSHTATTTHNGLFGNINNATIKNFSISGDLTSTYNYTGVIGLAKGNSTIKGIHSSLHTDIQYKGWAGGVVGGADGNVTIEECWFDGIFNTHNYADAKGGIVGYASSPTIKNCLFSGEFTGEKEQHYGGILGYVNSANFGGVQNCLSIGSVTTTNTNHSYVAAIIGNMNTNTKVSGITNNYWLTGSSYAGYAGAKASDENLEAAHEVTSEELASGEVAYKLGSAWYQTIGTEDTPVLDSSSEKVLYVGAAGYSTMYDAANNWKLVGDAHAYIGTINGSALHLDEIADIPVGTAVVISGTYYNKVSTTATADATGNVLKGSNGSVTGDGSTIFALSNKANGVGFYPVGDGVKIPAGKAYLEYTSTGGNGENAVKGFTFVFDEDDPTGIEDLKDFKDLKDSNVIYNIAGQRIQKMQRGINIVNGKKVLK